MEKLFFFFFYLQDQIELWYLERKSENWEMENYELSQQVFLSLKPRLKKCPIFNLLGDLTLSEEYYKKVLESYIADIKRISINLIEWLHFLFVQESKIYGENEIQFALKELFCQRVR